MGEGWRKYVYFNINTWPFVSSYSAVVEGERMRGSLMCCIFGYVYITMTSTLIKWIYRFWFRLNFHLVICISRTPLPKCRLAADWFTLYPGWEHIFFSDSLAWLWCPYHGRDGFSFVGRNRTLWPGDSNIHLLLEMVKF